MRHAAYAQLHAAPVGEVALDGAADPLSAASHVRKELLSVNSSNEIFHTGLQCKLRARLEPRLVRGRSCRQAPPCCLRTTCHEPLSSRPDSLRLLAFQPCSATCRLWRTVFPAVLMSRSIKLFPRDARRYKSAADGDATRHLSLHREVDAMTTSKSKKPADCHLVAACQQAV